MNPEPHTEKRNDGRPGQGTVLVVGSANMDLVVSCERFPRPGETVLSEALTLFPGGKGANQAVACARLGARVLFLGKMGDDVFRPRLLESLRANGVDTGAVLVDDEAATGVALITVDAAGENQIVVASGSNMQLTPADVEAQQALFQQADVVLLQLEIPLETVEKAVSLAKKAGAIVVLNPAPARALPDTLLRHTDWLTPNESEAAYLSGVEVRGRAGAERAAQKLVERGVRHVVVTLGGDGALLVTPDETRHLPARRVEVVDTTAAGDAFNGALACALAQQGGGDLAAALDFANRAAACAVTRRGAQAAMPTPADLAALDAGVRAAPNPLPA